ncbi:hypothetical protein J3L18_31155 [Mucilaginibacter gossypii]|nr:MULTISPECIES: hypothetical protein [Mucilaginibacter]WMH62884.1 hypothetical protein J3L18_31155 [Mucilaginibacter gossypii]
MSNPKEPKRRAKRKPGYEIPAKYPMQYHKNPKGWKLKKEIE